MNLGHAIVRHVGFSAFGVAAIRLGVFVACVVIAAAIPGAAAQAAPGDLDPSFGVGGKVTTNFGYLGTASPLIDEAAAVAVAPDGKIVTAGLSGNGTDFWRFAVARYNVNGSLDTTFGGDGTVTAPRFDGLEFDAARAVAVQPDGKIVTAGYAVVEGGPSRFALARFNRDGGLDATFGNGGEVMSYFDPYYAGDLPAAFAVAIQKDGKIVVGGSADDLSGQFGLGILARYTAGGALDSTFGGGGKVITPFPISSLVIRPDGSIVVAGTSSGDFALARYTATGGLDATFGVGGKVMTDFGGSSDRVYDATLQPDGKIVAAGSAAGTSSNVALARYTANGSLDPTFGALGKVVTDVGGAQDWAHGVATAANGKIVVAGSIGSRFGVARYSSSGTLDGTFGTGGEVTTDFGPGAVASDIAIQTDGKIVAAGTAQTANWADFALARYLGEEAAVHVSIDIKPGSATNPIQLSSQGVIPVAILTTNTFDARAVDPRTVCFGDDDHPAERDCTEAHGRGHIGDVNGDGRPDLLLHYEVSQTGIDPGDISATLTGKTFAGRSIVGSDSITTVPAKPTFH